MRGWAGILGAIAIVGASLGVAAPAGATDGQLDPVLGGDGIVTVTGLDHAWDVAAAPGSKIVVVGQSGTQPAVVRLNADGTPDTSFDGDGLALLPRPTATAEGSASAVAVLPDGSMAVTGSFGFDGDFTARISAAGALMSGFGATGIVYTDFAGFGSSRDVAVTPAGIVYRLWVGCGAPPCSVVYKYSATGTETEYDTPAPPSGNQGFFANHVLVQANGSVLLVGSSINMADGNDRLAIRRMTPAGATDTSYSGDGWAFAGRSDSAAGGLVGDKLVVAGTYTDAAGRHVNVARLTSAGALDTAFGGGHGFDVRTAPPGMDSVSDVATRVDGRFYLVGAPSSSATDLVVQRRLAAGGPDLAFSGGGVTIPAGTTVESTAGSTGPGGDLLVLGGGAGVLARIDGTDTTAPTGVAVTAPTTRFVLAKTLVPRWTATDPSGIGGYEVSRLGAAYNAVLPAVWSPFYTGTAPTAPYTAGAGTTQCFRVRAKDVWGTISAFSARRCVALPLTSASLVYGAGWTAKTITSAYGGVVRTTTKNAAIASRTGVYAKRVALVVTKCAACGSVKVKYAGTLAGHAYNVTSAPISLIAASTVAKQIVELAALPGLFHGTVSIQVTSATGRIVTIQGLGIYKD